MRAAVKDASRHLQQLHQPPATSTRVASLQLAGFREAKCVLRTKMRAISIMTSAKDGMRMRRSCSSNLHVVGPWRRQAAVDYAAHRYWRQSMPELISQVASCGSLADHRQMIRDCCTAQSAASSALQAAEKPIAAQAALAASSGLQPADGHIDQVAHVRGPVHAAEPMPAAAAQCSASRCCAAAAGCLVCCTRTTTSSTAAIN